MLLPPRSARRKNSNRNASHAAPTPRPPRMSYRLAPFIEFGCQKRPSVLRRRSIWNCPQHVDLLLKLRIIHRFADFDAKPFDDGSRGSGRRHTDCQAVASKPATPPSAIVGRSGYLGCRCALACPGLNVFASIWGASGGRLSSMTSI